MCYSDQIGMEIYIVDSERSRSEANFENLYIFSAIPGDGLSNVPAINRDRQQPQATDIEHNDIMVLFSVCSLVVLAAYNP